jgi:outer membrane protein insertion porin family
LGAYNKNIGYAPFERFWLGGSGLTGFALDGREIIALRGFANAGDATEGVSGGVAVAKYVMELRYPISLNPSATIFALAFAEAGNAWNSTPKFNPFNVARCAGAGVRVFLPMFGLLGLDYGWGFDNPWNKPGNAIGKGHFQFTIGANIGDL